MKINFIKIRWFFFTLSLIVILSGVWYYSGPKNLNLGIFTPKGFNLGNDFKGGIVHQIIIYSGIPQEEIRQYAIDLGLGSDVQKIEIPENKRIAKASSYLIKIPLEKDGDTKIIRDKIDKLYTKIREKYGDKYILTGEELKKANLINSEMLTGEDIEQKTADKRVLQNAVKETENITSVSFSATLRWQVIALVLFTLAIILLYVSVRFKFKYAFGGVLALVHDTLVMLAVISFFQLEFDYTMLASILFIIGYSINDTIVIYDRIRENYNIMKNTNSKDIINTSINQTLSRTFITSLTTLLADIALLIWGGPKIQGFSISIAVGIVSGTYSTIFIASPIVDSWDNFFGLFSKKRRKEIKEEKIIQKQQKEKELITENKGVIGEEGSHKVHEELDIKKDKIALSKKQLKKLEDLMKKKS